MAVENTYTNIVARVGQHQSFASYLGSYEQAVKQLFDSIVNGRESADLIAPPLLFLMRHSMELGYKFTLWELHEMNEEPYDFQGYKGHGLAKLHQALRESHRKAVEKYDLPDSHVENFKEHCEKTEAGMKLFSRLDFDSMGFRYPFNNQGNPNLPRDEVVDLMALKQAFDDAMILLKHTADVLGEYVDVRRWMEAEARANWF
jgi:hypothetical protein